VALHLAVDEQAIGRAVDIPVLDVHPRAIHQAMQMFDGSRLLARRHCDSGQRD
jgi:hypothetical protein